MLIPGEGRLLNGAKLSEALRISDSDLHVDLWQLKTRDWNSGLGGSPAHCMTALSRFKQSSMPEAISVNHVQEIVDLGSTLDESQFAGIARSLALFRELDALFETDFKLLGYFAVLEEGQQAASAISRAVQAEAEQTPSSDADEPQS